MDKKWGGRVARCSVENVLAHSTKKNSREHFCAVFRKNSDGEKVYGYERGEVSRFSFENYLSQSAEENRRGTL